MAIADFNRGNPFVIMCRYKLDELKSNLLEVTKSQIITGATSFVALSSYLALFFDTGFYFYFLPIAFTISLFVISLILYKNILKHSVYKELNSIIYGNEYKSINVDNERLLDLLLKLNLTIGKIEYHRLLLKYINIFNIGLMVILVAHFIIIRL